MRREVAIVVCVLVCGHSLYVAGAVVVAPALDDPGETSPVAQASADGTRTTLSFSGAAEEAGLDYEGTVTYRGTKGIMSNAGVYVGDVNGDGWSDLLLVGGDEPALFVNDGGTFHRRDLPTFDRTIRSALFVDYDTDGLDDLVLLSGGHPPLLLHNADGSFTPVDGAFERNLSVPVGATAADYDRDGCPDLFVVQNGNWLERHPAGERDYDVGPSADNGNPNYLYRGTCDGFERVDAGMNATQWSLAASFVDLTGDGRPDVHVTNDFNHDVVYVNRGNDSFERRTLGDQTNRNGMSSEVGDVNGDGRPDLFVTNIYYPVEVNTELNTTMTIRANGNNLLLNRGDGSFEEASQQYGVRIGGWGWAAALADLDNDGDLDLVHTTRAVSFEVPIGRFDDPEIARLHARYPSYRYPAVWENDGGEFRKASPPASGFGRSDGRGMATLDYDHDGALEVVIANATGPFRLYQNRNGDGRSLQLDLRRDGPVLGTEVRVETGGDRQTRVLTAEADFLSQESRTLHVGVGNATRADVTVIWPDGERTRLEAVTTGRRVIVSPEGVVGATAHRDRRFRAGSGNVASGDRG